MKTFRVVGGRKTKIKTEFQMRRFLKRLGLPLANILWNGIDGYQIAFCTGDTAKTTRLGRAIVSKFSGQLDLVELPSHLPGQGDGADTFAYIRGLRVHEICSR